MGTHESTQALGTLNAKGQTAALATLRHDLVEGRMRPSGSERGKWCRSRRRYPLWRHRRLPRRL